MHRSALLVLGLLTLCATLVGPALAMDMTCPDGMTMEPTLTSLHHCTMDCAAMGIINNVGVANSLLHKVTNAMAAIDRGQPAVAVHLLGAFINEVQAQAGVHIDAAHSDHMIMHAQLVIDALAP